MTNQFRFLLTFIVLVFISVTANAFSYYVSFTGSGASSTVGSVLVQNLTKSTEVTIPAGSQLRLYDVENSIAELNTLADFAFVYPNPMTGNATFSFVAKNDGKTRVSVFSLEGKKVAGLDIDLHQGKNSFELTLPKGVYLVQAKGTGFSYSIKTISLSLTDNQPKISYSGNTIGSKPRKAPAAEVKMQYTPGDQILYKGYSGNYCTIVTDQPTETKTTDFKFVDCTDADGNHYAVVHIGNQTWMAENLKTTKYRTGEAIGTTTASIPNNATSKYQWPSGGNEANVAKYGRLYTWYAATDSRSIAPVGWRMATDAEWTTLGNYLIANGYNYDGTTTGDKTAKSLASTTDWTTYSTTGTIGSDLSKNNKSGFTALPGGYRGSNGTFDYIGNYGYWWSSTEYSTTYAWSRYLKYYYADLYRYYYYKSNGFSVRCIRAETTNPLNIETALIPAGTFTMGSPTTEVDRSSDETQYPVTLSAYRMSKYEITNAQYAAFLNAKSIGSNGLYASGAYPTQALIYSSDIYGSSYDFGLHYNGSLWVPVAGYENAPIIFVTWYGATEYATYAGGSLPTEAQWEYACRATTTTPFNTGSCLTNLQANYRWDYPYSTCTNTVTTPLSKTQAVGSYAPNAYGLYDMHGNVWEWCADWYGTYPTTAQNNPTGATTGSYRVFRGGSWLSSAQYCRSAIRCSFNPYNNNTDLGFRVVFDTNITATLPVLTTTTVSSITSTTATSGGNITNDGGLSITSRGICWSTSTAPTIALTTKTTEWGTTGTYTSTMTGLTPNTKYYVRAYATNSVGTAYGEEVSFTTSGDAITNPTFIYATVADPACGSWTSQVTASQMNETIYNGAGLSKNEFHNIYNTMVDSVGGDGIIAQVADPLQADSYVINWNLTFAEVMAKLLYYSNTHEYTFKHRRTYKSSTPSVYPNIVINFQKEFTHSTLNIPLSKLTSNYWYDSYTLVKQSIKVPLLGETTTVGSNSFANNINEAFEQETSKRLSLTALPKNYKYFFVNWQPAISTGTSNITLVPGVDGQTLRVGSNTGEIVATINPFASGTGDVIVLNQVSVTAKTLLNVGTENLRARVGIKTVWCNDTQNPLSTEFERRVTVNGKTDFDVVFVRPINPQPATDQFFVDALNFGDQYTYLEIAKLTNLNDWRYTDPISSFATHFNYWSYYGVVNITADINNIKTDINQAVGVKVPLSQYPDLRVAHALTVPGVTNPAPTSPNTFFGYLTYNNTGSTLGREINLYVPITVTYVWGQIKNIVVTVPVKMLTDYTTLPILTTSAVSSIYATTAKCGGNITSAGIGGTGGISRGICWSTSTGPTIALTTKTTESGTTGIFTSTMTGLAPNTKYYVRAYATNNVGTAYGEEVSFTTSGDANTNPTFSYATVADPDCGSWTSQVTANQMNETIYAGAGLSKTEFHNIYNTMVDSVGGDGIIAQVPDPQQADSYVMNWNLTFAEVMDKLYNSPIPEYTFQHRRTYKSSTPAVYPNVVINFNKKFTRSTLNIPISKLTNNYWYDSYTLVKQSIKVPLLGETTTVGSNSFANNINEAFEQETSKRLSLTALPKNYKYFFVYMQPAISNGTSNITLVPGVDGQTLRVGSTTGEIVATINPFASGTGDVIVLNQVSATAKTLLNVGTENLRARVGIKTVWCNDTQNPLSTEFERRVTVNGKTDFDVVFVRPINPQPATDQFFVDGLNYGDQYTYLEIAKLTNLNDWRYPDPISSFATHFNYWSYYGVVNITADINNIKTDIAAGVKFPLANYPYLSVIYQPNIPVVTNPTPTSPVTFFGYLTYSNTGNTLGREFNLYVPITVTYAWGQIKNIVVTVPVKKSSYTTLPVLTTSAVSSITSTTATSGGNITSAGIGGYGSIARGVCWSTSTEPTIALTTKTTESGTTGTFTSTMTGLTPNTKYYVRAYATNNVGTAYGEEVSFTTSGTQEIVIQTALIPAGTFTMGSPTSEVNRSSNETQHSVTLSAFRMSKYEITNAQYAAFLNAKSIGSNGKYAAGAYPTQALIYASSGYDWNLHYNTNKWESVAGYENNPVNNVTWYGATEFATYVGGTLPTEAQWEYASRAGTTTPFNTGALLTNLQANYNWAYPYVAGTNTVTTYPGKTQTVGTYAANAYGLSDMHGNVSEWCSDLYGTYPTTAQTNPTGATTGSSRVIRGGGWNFFAQLCRSAFRGYSFPNDDFNGIGFRVVFDTSITATLPVLTTTTVSSITSTTATSGGNITNDGGAAITSRGVCWSTSTAPTIALTTKTTEVGIGTFTSTMTGLAPNTKYYVRAYATNNVGTAYGEEVSFTTRSDANTVTDIDGNVYHTITIGTQTWMVENLKTTRYRNGDAIPNVTDGTWVSISTGAWCDYDNLTNNGTKYGHLYNGYAVSDRRNLAPIGWHVPTDSEWTTLENYLIANGYNYDGTTIGDKIAKALAATTDWFTNNETGTIGNDLTKNNSSGFTALPGGGRFNNGTFALVGGFGFWLSSTERDAADVWTRSLCYGDQGLDRNSRTKSFGLSVRCIKDESTNPPAIETALIPAGTFTMGSPTSEVNRSSNETQHSVTLSAFRMSKYEITNAQYAAFLNAKSIGSNGKYAAGAYPTQALIYASSGSYDWGLHYSGTQWIPVTGYENAPVINVTWYGATEYATYVGGSLPTEAQWEYACRAGTTTPFSTGSCLTNLQANYNWLYPYSTCTNTITTYPGKTQAVGTYAPNGYGLYDMHGNVWEWCADWYGTYPSTAQTNPTGATTGSIRVNRGGSWINSAQGCRSALRGNSYPYDLNTYLGFRVVFVP